MLKRPNAEIEKTELLHVPKGDKSQRGQGTNSTSDVPAQAANVGTGTTKWKKVSEIKVGEKIAVTKEWDIRDDAKGKFNIGTGTLDFDEIISIKKVGREKVWDIEVEGTHNFVGNGILAHNTYINGKLTANSDVLSADELLFNVQNTGSNVFNVDSEGDYSY